MLADDDSNIEDSAVLCFCHLRWNFVYQRPQHVLSRAAQHAPVYFWEEPLYSDRDSAALDRTQISANLAVLTPQLPHGLSAEEQNATQRALLDNFIAENRVQHFVAWYYTPMALAFTDRLAPDVTVYDCMDELSAFQGAPPELIAQEQRLFDRADVVFAGGASLYEAKRTQHANVHAFPSSIDYKHFAAARSPQADPHDAAIARPRVGFFGVLDERLDRDLVRDMAAENPDLHFVLIGPVVKIREDELPRGANLHYLGKREYSELPSYLAHWDVAILPFARNASTRFISPTKTPEYLAAGKPVVSTPIRDVVRPYGDMGLVSIADNAPDFAAAIREHLAGRAEAAQQHADRFLAQTSWDKTFEAMWQQIEQCRPQTSRPATAAQIAYDKDGACV